MSSCLHTRQPLPKFCSPHSTTRPKFSLPAQLPVLSLTSPEVTSKSALSKSTESEPTKSSGHEVNSQSQAQLRS